MLPLHIHHLVRSILERFVRHALEVFAKCDDDCIDVGLVIPFAIEPLLVFVLKFLTRFLWKIATFDHCIYNLYQKTGSKNRSVYIKYRNLLFLLCHIPIVPCCVNPASSMLSILWLRYSVGIVY